MSDGEEGRSGRARARRAERAGRVRPRGAAARDLCARPHAELQQKHSPGPGECARQPGQEREPAVGDLCSPLPVLSQAPGRPPAARASSSAAAGRLVPTARTQPQANSRGRRPAVGRSMGLWELQAAERTCDERAEPDGHRRLVVRAGVLPSRGERPWCAREQARGGEQRPLGGQPRHVSQLEGLLPGRRSGLLPSERGAERPSCCSNAFESRARAKRYTLIARQTAAVRGHHGPPVCARGAARDSGCVSASTLGCPAMSASHKLVRAHSTSCAQALWMRRLG